MQFQYSNVWKQLKTKGAVATLRNFPYSTGQQIKATNGNTIIKATVVLSIEEPVISDIKRYAYLSGFKDWKGWTVGALYSNQGVLPKYLYILQA